MMMTSDTEMNQQDKNKMRNFRDDMMKISFFALFGWIALLFIVPTLIVWTFNDKSIEDSYFFRIIGKGIEGLVKWYET